MRTQRHRTDLTNCGGQTLFYSLYFIACNCHVEGGCSLAGGGRRLDGSG